MRTTPELVTGVDVSDRLSTYVTITTRGDVEEEGRVRTTAPAMRTHFEGRLEGSSSRRARTRRGLAGS
jgi:hypothetical protein